MAKDKCPVCPPTGAPDWMVTYGDLMTLLLCFFVLLFSFSSMETKKFESLKESMRGAFGVFKGESTTLGKGKSKKPSKASWESFDKSISEVIKDVKNTKVPKIKVQMLEKAVLAATEAILMVSEEQQEVEKIVKELEKPTSILDETSDNFSRFKKKVRESREPRNFPTERKQFSGATERRMEEPESASRELDPPRSKGENQDPFSSDATKVDIAPGRDQQSMNNTGRQKTRDKETGKKKAKKKFHDKEKYRSEDKDFDFKEQPDSNKTMDEFTTLAGLVQVTNQELSHAVFHFDQELLFEKDAVELKDEAKEIVYKVFLDNYKKDAETVFQIESHTDFSSPPSKKYPTTWHIAAARGQAILNFLLDENYDFDPARFNVVSFGAYQPRYKYGNNQVAIPYNRRLEVRMFQKP